MRRTSFMARTPALMLLMALGVASGSALAQSVQTPGAGAALFESRCAACHSLEANRVGPMLRGVVGRKVASAAGYGYSDALKRVKGQWNAAQLEKWLQDPQSVAAGTKMAFSVPSATDRKAVIQYLASASARDGGSAARSRRQ